MKYTKEHSFSKPESFDDVINSISSYATNFDEIDSLLPKSVPNLLLHLQQDTGYNSGKIIYNESPNIGDYAGWINVRTGVHAPFWRKEQIYNINDVVIPTPNNGYFYRCITDGRSAPLQPTFPTTGGATVDDTYGIASWIPSQPYSVGDIVKATSGGSTHYYKCITAGTTGATEPIWNNTAGVIVVDGSISWLVCKKAVWKQEGVSSEFRPFGKID